jgi:transcriptional regulator with XRE-family HTH domain
VDTVDVRTQRLAKHLTLEQLATASGISYAWLSRVERCAAPLSPKSAAIIAVVLGVEADQLIQGHDRLRARRRAELMGGAAGELAR